MEARNFEVHNVTILTDQEMINEGVKVLSKIVSATESSTKLGYTTTSSPRKPIFYYHRDVNNDTRDPKKMTNVRAAFFRNVQNKAETQILTENDFLFLQAELYLTVRLHKRGNFGKLHTLHCIFTVLKHVDDSARERFVQMLCATFGIKRLYDLIEDAELYETESEEKHSSRDYSYMGIISILQFLEQVGDKGKVLPESKRLVREMSKEKKGILRVLVEQTDKKNRENETILWLLTVLKNLPSVLDKVKKEYRRNNNQDSKKKWVSAIQHLRQVAPDECPSLFAGYE